MVKFGEIVFFLTTTTTAAATTATTRLDHGSHNVPHHFHFLGEILP